ncbi:FtsW/RodA/SpoVE family cell cycle protein [Bacillus sp. OK048]|uniref:FtsW/RodA/SpoVE family cell cycle protein n=1 Tax=Bacillus sp. OK048 TaxID=1882761 RepID=UPI000B86559A|nr:FtsW/RodA/SpoVE family cell cycle protein [Bacillus sp. OK048]
MTNNKKQIFLNEVTDQIRSKEAKNYVANELNYHLKEAKRIWVEKGLPEGEAEEKAVEQMGSPTKLGIQMNKLHRPKVDWWLVILLAVALGLSFLPMISLGYMESRHFLIFKILIVIVGIAAVAILMLIDYRKWEKHGWLFYILGIFLLLILQFPNVVINGLPLFKLGPVTIESMMAVPLFFLAWAAFFNNEKFKIWQFVLLLCIPMFLFFSLRSIPISYIYFVMVFIMLWWSKFSRKVIITISTAIVGSIVLASFLVWQLVQPYQMVRILAFLDPENYADGAGFTILKIQEFLSKAGWFGSTTSGEFIPEAHTNLVFVSFTYYYGWLFAIVLVAILSLFVARMVVILPKVKDSYGRLLLIGGLALYGVQLVSNIGMALGLFPLTSMSLPFMSYGLMPTVLNAVIIGVVLSVYRRKDLVCVR